MASLENWEKWGSWVYVFSKFTPEALIFECLIISALCAGYAAFWILRKRRMGVIDEAVPAGVVKVYLNELINDAEQMRKLLFGLLQSAGASMDAARIMSMPASGAGHSVSMIPTMTAAPGQASNDPALVEKLVQLEAKMAEQMKSMQSLVSEKERLERELSLLKAGGAGAGAGAPGAVDTSAFQEKIKQLEGKLAEYSVIEDDLANLKRLQQENIQLKATLGGGKDAPAAATPAAEPAAAPTGSMPAMGDAAAMVAQTAQEASTAPAAPAAAAPPQEAMPAEAIIAEPSIASPAEPAFEGLVNQVEQSLAAAATPPASNETIAAPMSDPSTPKPGADTIDKSDADLVAEFEKMLNS